MTDTPEHILKLQATFFLQKPLDERLRIGLGMMEEGRNMVEGALKRQNPHWSEGELKAAVFRRMYADEFLPDELNRIAQSFISYYTRR